jgi:hypothetical protein
MESFQPNWKAYSEAIKMNGTGGMLRQTLRPLVLPANGEPTGHSHQDPPQTDSFTFPEVPRTSTNTT